MYCYDAACRHHGYSEAPREHCECECARNDEGSGLLRVCKRVNEDASRIFWGGRRWGFDDGLVLVVWFSYSFLFCYSSAFDFGQFLLFEFVKDTFDMYL